MHIFIHVLFIVTLLALDSLSLADCYIACGEGEYNKDGYRDQIVTSCAWVRLCFPRHIHCSCTTDIYTSIRACFLYFSLLKNNSYMQVIVMVL